MRVRTLFIFFIYFPTLLFAEQEMNREFREGYQNARDRILATHGPIIISKGNFLILYYRGEREEVRYLPQMYHKLKEIDHIPLALSLFINEQKVSKEWLWEFEKRIVKLRNELDFPNHLLKRQQSILDQTINAIHEIDTDESLVRFCRGIAPDLLKNADQAAFIQLEALHAQVQKWKSAIPKEEWDRMAAIVIGPQMPRVGEVTLQYFSRLTGNSLEKTQILPSWVTCEKEVKPSKKERRLIYAENLWNEKEALNLLATHILDERIGHLFFNDKQRMFYDLLSEGASRRLEDKCHGTHLTEK